MRIIERHDLEWTTRITCGQCRSILEAEPKDVAKQTGGGVQWDYTPDSFYLTCPVCSRRNTLDKSTVPSWVQSRAIDPTKSYGYSR